LCFIHGQYSEAVVVDLDRGNRAPFTKLVITSLPGTSDSVAASPDLSLGLMAAAERRADRVLGWDFSFGV